MGENSKGKSVSDLNWELEKLRESSANALNMSWAEVERLEKEKTMYKERAQKLKEKINYYSQFDFQNDRSQHSQSTKDDMEDSSTVIAKGSLAQNDSEPNSFQGWGSSNNIIESDDEEIPWEGWGQQEIKERGATSADADDASGGSFSQYINFEEEGGEDRSFNETSGDTESINRDRFIQELKRESLKSLESEAMSKTELKHKLGKMELDADATFKTLKEKIEGRDKAISALESTAEMQERTLLALQKELQHLQLMKQEILTTHQ